jgi:hypothetical protein
MSQMPNFCRQIALHLLGLPVFVFAGILTPLMADAQPAFQTQLSNTDGDTSVSLKILARPENDQLVVEVSDLRAVYRRPASRESLCVTGVSLHGPSGLVALGQGTNPLISPPLATEFSPTKTLKYIIKVRREELVNGMSLRFAAYPVGASNCIGPELRTDPIHWTSFVSSSSPSQSPSASSEIVDLLQRCKDASGRSLTRVAVIRDGRGLQWEAPGAPVETIVKLAGSGVSAAEDLLELQCDAEACVFQAQKADNIVVSASASLVISCPASEISTLRERLERLIGRAR